MVTARLDCDAWVYGSTDQKCAQRVRRRSDLQVAYRDPALVIHINAYTLAAQGQRIDLLVYGWPLFSFFSCQTATRPHHEILGQRTASTALRPYGLRVAVTATPTRAMTLRSANWGQRTISTALRPYGLRVAVTATPTRAMILRSLNWANELPQRHFDPTVSEWP